MPMIIQNSIIPFGRDYFAINLFGVIFAKQKLNERQLRHELIHTAQQREMLFLPFFIWYVAEWTIRLVRCRSLHRAYATIAFEREAYRHEQEKDYLSRRPRFAWLHDDNVK